MVIIMKKLSKTLFELGALAAIGTGAYIAVDRWLKSHGGYQEFFDSGCKEKKEDSREYVTLDFEEDDEATSDNGDEENS
jgi:hypothetical protein